MFFGGWGEGGWWGGEEAEKTLFRERKREGILYQDGHSRKTLKRLFCKILLRPPQKKLTFELRRQNPQISPYPALCTHIHEEKGEGREGLPKITRVGITGVGGQGTHSLSPPPPPCRLCVTVLFFFFSEQYARVGVTYVTYPLLL